MLPINAQKINEQKLGDAQAKWKVQCYNRVLGGNEGVISCPFLFGIPAGYTESEKTVMLVGQETRNLTCDYEKWSIPSMQTRVIEYTERQLAIGGQKDIAYNSSPFWEFARALKEKGYFPCWNNLEKVTQYDGDAEHRLKRDDEGYQWRRILNGQVSPYDQSLLQREIELAKPDIVVFAIGSKDPYWSSLAYAFDIDKYIITDHRPTFDRPCVDITRCLSLHPNEPHGWEDMPRTYWTYHPQFLSRSGLFKRVIEKITKS